MRVRAKSSGWRALAASTALLAATSVACEGPPPSPTAAPTPAPTSDPVQARAPEPAPEPISPDARALAELEHDYPLRVDFDPALQNGRWFDAAFALADRTHVDQAFDGLDYDPPRGSLLLVTRIEAGVEQPRYHYFTIDDTGFLPAPKYFVPASTVKLMASISALWTLSKYGLTGDAKLTFKDIDGRFRGTAYDLYKDALLHSSNENYNRLVAIAGFDETNTDYITAERGMPIMTIQSRYGPKNRGYGLRVSPTIHFDEGDKSGEIPKRKGEWSTDACRGNCTTLFELQDIMRRVMLHDELPSERRFPLARVDLERIQGLLLQARNRLQPSPNRAFGEKVDVYNEVGRIPGRVLLENSYLVAKDSGRRIMLALSLRFKKVDPKPELQVMAKAALDVTLNAPLTGPGLQADAGPHFELYFLEAEATPQRRLVARGPSATFGAFEAWHGNTSLGEPDCLSVNDETVCSWPVPTSPAREAASQDPEAKPEPSAPPSRPLPWICVGTNNAEAVAYRGRWTDPPFAVALVQP